MQENRLIRRNRLRLLVGLLCILVAGAPILAAPAVHPSAARGVEALESSLASPAGQTLGDAPPTWPYSPWGTLTINGEPAPVGTVLTAWIGGVQYASHTVANAGWYTLSVPSDDPSTPGKQGGVDGETVVFRAAGQTAAPTGTFASGTSPRIDLAVSIPTATPTATATATRTATSTPSSTPTRTITPTPSNTPTRTTTPQTTTVPTPSRTPTRAGGVHELVLQQGRDGYQGFEDTFINDWDQERNYHLAWNIEVRSPQTKRTLLKADVSVLAPGTIIENATLTLCLAEDSPVPLYTQIYEMLTEWDGRDATWLERKAKLPWGTKGANGIGVDRGSAVLFERRIFPTSGSYPNYPFDFDVTTLVQGWVNAPAFNFGLMIDSNTVTSSEFRFRSSDHGEIQYRPKLTIHFREGPPVTPTPTATGSLTMTPTPSITHTPWNTPTATTTPTQTAAHGELTGRAFVDANRNGLLDPGEQVLQGVVLDLRGMAGGVYSATRVTSADGRYLFSMLDAGQYELTVSSVPTTYRLIGSRTYGMIILAGAVLEINIPLEIGSTLALPLVLQP